MVTKEKIETWLKQQGIYEEFMENLNHYDYEILPRFVKNINSDETKNRILNGEEGVDTIFAAFDWNNPKVIEPNVDMFAYWSKIDTSFREWFLKEELDKNKPEKDIYFKDIKLKAGMGIYLNDCRPENLYVIFPRDKGLGVISYGLSKYWEKLNNFINQKYNDIVEITDLSHGNSIVGQILWQKKLKLTKKEIAEKFDTSEDLLEII